MENNDLGEPNRENEPIESGDETAGQPIALTLDIEKYEHFFEDEDMTEDQKREYLETLWAIVVSFIQMGVDVSPASNNCGKHTVSADDRKNGDADMVELSPQHLNDTFVSAADRLDGSGQKGAHNDQ